MEKQLFCDFWHFNILYNTIQKALLINKKMGVNIIYTKIMPRYFPNSPTVMGEPGKFLKVLFKKVKPKIIQIKKYIIKEVKNPAGKNLSLLCKKLEKLYSFLIYTFYMTNKEKNVKGINI